MRNASSSSLLLKEERRWGEEEEEEEEEGRTKKVLGHTTRTGWNGKRETGKGETKARRRESERDNVWCQTVSKKKMLL